MNVFRVTSRHRRGAADCDCASTEIQPDAPTAAYSHLTRLGIEEPEAMTVRRLNSIGGAAEGADERFGSLADVMTFLADPFPPHPAQPLTEAAHGTH